MRQNLRHHDQDAAAAPLAPRAGRALDRLARCRPCMLLALALLAGCRQGVYQAATLPAQLAAPATAALATPDLSRLATPSADSELIYPGDVLEISIATGLEEEGPLSWTLRVSDSGQIDVPLVGAVTLAGLRLSDAEREIRLQGVRRQVYRDPNVSVLRKERRANRVTVVGEVEQPATYELPAPSSDVVAALAAAGGLTEEAGSIIEIRRPAAVRTAAGPGAQLAGYSSPTGGRAASSPSHSIRVDLSRPDLAAPDDMHLADGSVVMVMKKPERAVQVIGLVKQPNQIEMPVNKDLRLLDALAQAGGRTLQQADKVRIIRRPPSGDRPLVIEASVREAKRGGAANLLLADGDVVSVEETPLTFTIETLRNFLRFGFSSAIPGI